MSPQNTVRLLQHFSKPPEKPEPRVDPPSEEPTQRELDVVRATARA